MRECGKKKRIKTTKRRGKKMLHTVHVDQFRALNNTEGPKAGRHAATCAMQVAMHSVVREELACCCRAHSTSTS